MQVVFGENHISKIVASDSLQKIKRERMERTDTYSSKIRSAFVVTTVADLPRYSICLGTNFLRQIDVARWYFVTVHGFETGSASH